MVITAQLPTASVFLVSGGAKGVTAQCVIKIARSAPCKWILLGRSALAESEPDWAVGCEDEPILKQRIMQDIQARGDKPTPMAVNRIYRSLMSSREIKTTLRTLESLGSEAAYVSADVTNAAAVKDGIAPAIAKFGPITGVIHGAGNLADKLIEKKTEQDFERVYGPKIKGLENLLNAVPASQLQYLVLFSSVAGFYGNAGQSDYTLSNEILNKSSWLIKQQHPSCHVVAINWGPWDSGMVTPQLKKEFERRKIDILPVDDATDMLVNELNPRTHDTAQVVVGGPIHPPLAVIDGELKTHRLRRRLSLDVNPFLHDHVIEGKPVLPFTCSLSWFGNAGEHLYPGYKTFVCEEVKVLKGIVFDESLADEYVLDIQELSKHEDEIVLEGKVWSLGPNGKPRYHFSNRFTLVREIPQAPKLETMDLTPDGVISLEGTEFYEVQPNPLFHGPAFHGLQKILNIDEQRVTAQYLARNIGHQNQGQFPSLTLDAYISDIQTHSVWIWLRHFYSSVCLPAKIVRFEHWQTPPYDQPFYTTTTLVSKTETRLAIDITVHAEDGTIYSRITSAEATIFPLSSKVA